MRNLWLKIEKNMKKKKTFIVFQKGIGEYGENKNC